MRPTVQGPVDSTPSARCLCSFTGHTQLRKRVRGIRTLWRVWWRRHRPSARGSCPLHRIPPRAESPSVTGSVMSRVTRAARARPKPIPGGHRPQRQTILLSSALPLSTSKERWTREEPLPSRTQQAGKKSEGRKAVLFSRLSSSIINSPSQAALAETRTAVICSLGRSVTQSPTTPGSPSRVYVLGAGFEMFVM